MTVSTEIRRLIDRRGITRVCHFAPFRNFQHIISGGSILCSARIAAEHPDVFNPTDDLRLDGMPNHVSCSIEYPNVYYLRKLEEREDVFVDHAVFLIDPVVLLDSATEYCPRNSASQYGTMRGIEGISSIFAPTVAGKADYSRGTSHPPWLPTDLQAEVHVSDSVPLRLVKAVVVKDETRAKRLLAQLEGARNSLDFPLYVSAGIFSRDSVRRLRSGSSRPKETLYAS